MWLDVGHLLKSRIEAVMPSNAKVFIVDEIQESDNNNNYPFTYFIAYGDYSSPVETIGDCSAVVEQSWHVIVAAREVTTGRVGASRMAAVNDMCDILIESLLGYRLSDTHSALQIVSPPSVTSDSGIIYIPFTFKTQILLRGSNNG